MVVEAYETIVRRTVSGELPPRFVVFRETENAGWGNHLRGLSFALLMAVLTDRVLLVDDPLVLQFFDSPNPDIDWRWSVSGRLAGMRPTTRVVDPHTNDYDRQAMQVSDLNEVFDQQILVLQRGRTYDLEVANNPRYRERIRGLFGDIDARIRRNGMMAQYLCSRPCDWYLNAVKEHMGRIGLSPSISSVGVQYRSSCSDIEGLFPAGASLWARSRQVVRGLIHRPRSWRYWAHAEIRGEERRRADYFRNACRSLCAQLAGEGPALIYVASDQDLVRAELAQDLAAYGRVVHGAQFVHTKLSLLPNEMLTVRREAFNQRRFDRTGPVNPAMIDWYVLGECGTLISTMTTYAVYAGARTGNRQKAYKVLGYYEWDGKGYCRPLKDDIYVF